MKIKEKVLGILQNNRGKYVSGEDMAKSLDCSRTAIWKAIKALKEDDFSIDSVSNKGYCLKEKISLDLGEIKKEVKSLVEGQAYLKVSSTNEVAKKIIIEQKPQKDYFVVAKKQDMGKRKDGNIFKSPKEKGIYLSVILKPKFNLKSHTLIMSNIVTEIVSILRNETGKDIKIKWLNEIFYKNKKIGGILTEAITDFETGNIQYAIVGVGIYLLSEKNEINGIFHKEDEINKINTSQLIGKIINGIIKASKENILNEKYKDYNYLLNREITIKSQEGLYKGVFKDINEQGELVLYSGSSKKIFTIGEIIEYE